MDNCILNNGGKESQLERFKMIAQETKSLLPPILQVFCSFCNTQHLIENTFQYQGDDVQPEKIKGYYNKENIIKFDPSRTVVHRKQSVGETLVSWFEEKIGWKD